MINVLLSRQLYKVLKISKMPTEEARKKFILWFKKCHPKEHYFFSTIKSNLEKICPTGNLAFTMENMPKFP